MLRLMIRFGMIMLASLALPLMAQEVAKPKVF